VYAVNPNVNPGQDPQLYNIFLIPDAKWRSIEPHYGDVQILATVTADDGTRWDSYGYTGSSAALTPNREEPAITVRIPKDHGSKVTIEMITTFWGQRSAKKLVVDLATVPMALDPRNLSSQ
jgi:hypothetical protein